MAISPGGMIALAVFFSILPLTAVGLRMWARRILKAKYGLDDYCIFFAMIVCIGSGIANIYGAIHGETGRHQDVGLHGEPIFTERLRVAGQIKYATQILDLLCFTAAKLSVLFLYRRIFSITSFMRIANIMLAIAGAWGVSFLFTIIFQCTPIHVQWTMLEIEQAPYCVAMNSFFYANVITDVLLDAIILTLPVPLLYGLQLPLRQKLAVAGMFALGALVCASSLARLIIFIQFVPSIPLHLMDITYYESPFIYWSQIEAALGVVSACLPVLRPIFVRPKIGKTYTDSESRATSPYGVDRSNFKDDSLQDPFHDKKALVTPKPSMVEERKLRLGLGNAREPEVLVEITEKELPRLPNESWSEQELDEMDLGMGKPSVRAMV